MPLTPSVYIPIGVATRGAGARRPWTAVARATNGRIIGFPEGVEPGDPLPADPSVAISSATIDANGIQHLLDDEVLAFNFAEVDQHRFANPDGDGVDATQGFTGYSASGFWYENGVPDPTHVPFKATWATEGESAASLNRGELDRFPARLFTIVTKKEIVLIDADNLEVWMRFVVPTVEPVSPPWNNGAFLHGPSIKIRDAIFLEGFLVVATNQGLRIADFSLDRSFIYKAGQSFEVSFDLNGRGLDIRNDDSYFEGILASGAATRRVVDDDCLCLDMSTVGLPVSGFRNMYCVAAVGHPNGLTGVILCGQSEAPPPPLPGPPTPIPLPGVPLAAPQTNRSLASRDFTVPGWLIEDDGGSDGGSAWFRDNVSNWAGLGVQSGDRITHDHGVPQEYDLVLHQINAGNRLELTPRVGLAAAGTDYTIFRNVTAVRVAPAGVLYFANGPGKINVIRNSDWWVGGSIFVELVSTGDFVTLAAQPGRINDMALRGTDLYIATDVGVFFATEESFTPAGGLSELRYSTEAQVDLTATYKILEGEEVNCVAVVVDPETGSIMVAVTDFESVVSEINPGLQKTFRFFDKLGRVKAMVAYRNFQGPPDVEVP